MSNPHQEFITAHGSEIHAVVDLAQELPNFLVPLIKLEANVLTGDTTAHILGQPAHEFAARTGSEKSVTYTTQLAVSQLQGVAIRAAVHLAAAEIGEPEKGLEHMRAQFELFNATGSHTATDVTIADTNMAVTLNRVTSNSTPITARELTVYESDGGVNKTLRIKEMPASFDGTKTDLKVRQKIDIAGDESGRRVKAFFEAHDSLEDLNGINHMFFTLPDTEKFNDEMAHLEAKYASLGALDDFNEIQSLLWQKIESLKADNEIARAFPGVNLPSIEDIKRYASLFRSVQS